VPPAMRTALVPVGRLDFHTEGLLILTDDGELAQRLSHPRHGCHKTYEVKVSGAPDLEKLDRLRKGVMIDGRRTSPCRIEALRTTPTRGEEGGNAWFRVQLAEGRTRQIREMFFRVGHPVQKLRRIAIGPVSDPQMPVGSFRELSESELAALWRVTAAESLPSPKTAARPERTRKPKRPAGPGQDARGARSGGVAIPARFEAKLAGGRGEDRRGPRRGGRQRPKP
jgi:23S rRNA pseudouridine2605 synthase